MSYVIASPVARKSTDALRYCFVYTLANRPETTVIEGALGKGVEPPVLRLSGVAESCHRHITPGVTGNWAFNFTSNGKFDFDIILTFRDRVVMSSYDFVVFLTGTCATDNDSSCAIVIPTLVLVLSSVIAACVIR